MAQWFECKVKYNKVNDNGLEVSVTEPFLVDAVSHGDAESRIWKEMEQMVNGEFVVKTCRKTKYHEIIAYDAEFIWFKCILSIIDSDKKTGKEKPLEILVNAETVETACKRIHETYKQVPVLYTIKQVGETAIVDVFPWMNEDDDESEE